MSNGFPPIPQFPDEFDDDSTLYQVYNTSETLTVSDNDAFTAEIAIRPQPGSKAEIWADNGYATISGELFYYDNVDKNGEDRVCRLRRCVRGISGRQSQFNSAGTWVRGFVVAEHHNQLSTCALLIENFVGENFSTNPATLDWRIRHLADAQIISDDALCPNVEFDFNILSSSPISGTIASYSVQVQGNSSFTLQFGDGQSTTSAKSGTHTYAPGANIDPVVIMNNDACQTVQTTNVRSSNPNTPTAGNTANTPFFVPVPTAPVIPPIVIPSLIIPPPSINIPPIVFPSCAGGGGIPSTILVSVIGAAIPSVITISPSVPSSIQITDFGGGGPFNFPTYIPITDFGGGSFDFPSTIQITDFGGGSFDFPSTIQITDFGGGSFDFPSYIPLIIDAGSLSELASTVIQIEQPPIIMPRGIARLATTESLPTNTYNNGSSGVGATLTGNSNGLLSIDGTEVNTGNTVLIMNEATPANNGLYQVTAVGSVSTPYVLTRKTNFDSPSDIPNGFISVSGGVDNADTSYRQTTPSPITIGTTAIEFEQYTPFPVTFMPVDIDVTIDEDDNDSDDDDISFMLAPKTSAPQWSSLTSSVKSMNLNASSVKKVTKTFAGKSFGEFRELAVKDVSQLPLTTIPTIPVEIPEIKEESSTMSVNTPPITLQTHQEVPVTSTETTQTSLSYDIPPLEVKLTKEKSVSEVEDWTDCVRIIPCRKSS